MIRDEKIRRGGPEEEMIRLAQQGKIETILSCKVSIDLDCIFPHLVVLPPPSPRNICLIEGAPGGGKSTLALHICHQWAQGASWLARFDIVVLAYLRDEAIQNAKTLADILPARNPEMSQSLASQLQATDGRNVLFIFDGWDEFPSNLMNNSFVAMIIQQPHKFSLHQSTVVITSRPVASGNLLHVADRRVEILGFTRRQIHEYIEKALDGNSTHVQTLVQHLEEHPVIEGYCYIPLHSAILVHIFLTMKGALPTTLHELFCDFVLCCIVREQATHELDTSLPSEQHISSGSLDDLPGYLKHNLRNLSVLAYNGVTQDRVVFYSDDLQQSNLPSNLSSLGLLQAVEGLTLTSKSLSYNFLHLSVQELLTAYHISQMPPREQVKVFKKMFESSRFQAVLQYYCGFTKLDNPEIQEFISMYHCDKSCSLEELLPLLHCLFEAQQPSLCHLVDPEFTTDIELDFADINNPSDYLAVGYFITSLLSTSTADMPPVQLTIQCKHTDDLHCLKLLLSELTKYRVGEQRTACAQSRKLVFMLGTNDEYPGDIDVDDEATYMYKPSITGKGVKLIAAHLKISLAISELVLYEGAIQRDKDGLLLIAEALQTNTSLTKLSLVNVNLHHSTEQNVSALIKMLRVNKSLEYLNLSGNYITSATHCCIFEGLRDNTTLTHLILHNTCMQVSDPDTAESLTEMLQVNKTLTHLDISGNYTFSQRGACCIFNGLQHNTALTHLLLSDYYIFQRYNDPDTVRSLNLMLQVNNSLTHLDLSKSIKFSESESSYIFEALQHNTSLLNLNLSRTSITATDPDASRSLTKMFQVNKSLTHLDLSYNEFPGAHCIFEGLQDNTALVSLNLSNTGMTDPDTARSLTEMFQVNKSLLHLDLSKNVAFSESGACCIFECLQHNTTLLNLNLSNTGITAADPGTARSLTKMLQVNKSLTHLDLSSNEKFLDSGARCIFVGLQDNTALTSLNLKCTGITATDPDTARSLTKMLQVNKSLTHIDFSSNETFSDSGARCIFEGLQHNTTLVNMNLCSTGIKATDPGTARSLTKVLQVN